MSLSRTIGRFLAANDGGLAVYAALAIPVVLAMAGGMIDITTAQSERSQLYNIAQGAALVGAGDLALAANSSMATQRSKAWAESEIANLRNPPATTVTASIVEITRGQRGVRVDIAANRPSIFGRILPPGGWHINVFAVAAPLGTTPLCVIATQTDKSRVINVRNSGAISAPGCMIHSNRDVLVENSGHIEAGLVEAVGAISGDINPDGVPDAPTMDDPFANVNLTAPNGVNQGNVTWTTGVHTLAPGYHRQHIDVRGNAILRLQPGEHWFVHADLKVRENARVEGDDVVLMFDRECKFEFRDDAVVRLDGRHSGPLSGFVLVATRDNNKDFTIDSDHVESLLGVVYAPSARLVIEGHAQVARQSAWTVIVAKAIQLNGNPTLYLNANYRGSEVPVPSGVGPRAGTRLVQ